MFVRRLTKTPGKKEYILGTECHDEQQDAKAERHFRQSVQQREKVLGTEHEDTLKSRYWLALTLHYQQKYTKAKRLLRQSVQQREKVLGEEHKDTLWSRYWLALTLYSQNKYAEAERLLRQSVQQREKVLGAEHENTLESKRLLQILLTIALPVILNTAVELVASHLRDYFVECNSRVQYTDSEIYQISLLLKQSNMRWSRVPRTYIILRIIGCLDLLDTFIDLDYSDH